MLKEIDIAKSTVTWLTASDWVVYQEVQTKWGSGIADIVAVKGSIIHVIECKKSLGFRVVGQAMRWQPWATLTSVCVPPARRSRDDELVIHRCLKHLGVGLIRATGYGASQVIQPRLHRNAATKHFTEVLCEEMKTYALAGGKDGYWTPHKHTMRNLAAAVQEKPGMTWKEALDSMTHHYQADRTARACLTMDIEAGRLEGVELRKEGKAWHLYPKEREDGKD